GWRSLTCSTGEALTRDGQGDEGGHAARSEQCRQFGIILLALMAAGDEGYSPARIGGEGGFGRLWRGRDRVIDRSDVAEDMFFETMRQGVEGGDAGQDALHCAACGKGDL